MSVGDAKHGVEAALRRVDLARTSPGTSEIMAAVSQLTDSEAALRGALEEALGRVADCTLAAYRDSLPLPGIGRLRIRLTVIEDGPRDTAVEIVSDLGKSGSDAVRQNDPKPPSPRRSGASGQRLRLPHVERELRQRVWAKVSKVTTDFATRRGKRTQFTAGSKTGLLCLSTHQSGSRDEYFLGFDSKAVVDPPNTIIVAATPEGDYVLPFGENRAFFDQLWSDSKGNKKLYILNEGGNWVMRGGSMTIGLSRFQDRFEVFSLYRR